ncbi:MAG: UbiA family prenyltransferase [Vampirovibrio sp.]
MNWILKWRALASLVKWEHSIFALPFALTGLLLANQGTNFPHFSTVLWVILAMLGGRTYAMGLNRLADARLDALNPRTANRELPSGIVSAKEAWGLTLGALGLLIVATLQLPLLCQTLLPVAIGILTLYSYTKRFTSLCHLILGVALGASAIGGWLAQTGAWQGGLSLWFGAGVALWVMGFDIIYACQDTAFDHAHGLYSIPVKWGNERALLLSRWVHGASVLSLLIFAWQYSHHPRYGFIGWGFYLALLIMAALLIKEHRLVRADDLSRVNQAFFILNGQISLGFFSVVFLERLLRRFLTIF